MLSGWVDDGEEKAEAVTEKKGYISSVVSAFDTQDELFDDVTQR